MSLSRLLVGSFYFFRQVGIGLNWCKNGLKDDLAKKQQDDAESDSDNICLDLT